MRDYHHRGVGDSNYVFTTTCGYDDLRIRFFVTVCCESIEYSVIDCVLRSLTLYSKSVHSALSHRSCGEGSFSCAFMRLFVSVVSKVCGTWSDAAIVDRS